ncbi:UDP-glycosyltransferase UGT5-like isoform X2 [Harmonia axyridis]|nr:UDP-glycosyltransferase UGT5-like isoform X2 [Harmonia axyridis]
MLSVHEMMEMILASHDRNFNICSNLFSTKEMRNFKDTDKKYDLLIFEVFAYDCIFGFAHKYKVPVIALTSSVNLPWGANRIGNPDNPSYIPTYFRDLLPEMTLYERILNTFTLLHAKLLHYKYLQIQDEEARKFFGEDMPYLEDIVSNTSLFIVNSHFSLDQARPNVPNFVEAAGLHINEVKPLDSDLQDILGDSKFIYFSIGTVLSSDTIPLEKLQNICDAFDILNYKVLWKTDRKKLPKGLRIPSNVNTQEWVPQLDILCNPNILFFFTHSGLLGTQEAIYCGVPMLSIPIFADQHLNSKNMVSKGVALHVIMEEFTQEEIIFKMRDLIENPKYKDNAMSLSIMFKDRPNKPLDEAVYWIEYVLRYKGAPQLRSRAADMAWYQYYLVDITSVVVLSLSVFSFIIYRLVKFFLGVHLNIKFEPKYKNL